MDEMTSQRPAPPRSGSRRAPEREQGGQQQGDRDHGQRDQEERGQWKRSPTVGRHLLAAELKELRIEAGLTHVDLAYRLGWPQAKVSKIESARQGAGVEAVMALADLCHASGRHRERLVELAHAARRRGWWEAYQDVLLPAERTCIGFEAAAVTVHIFAVEEVPEQVRTMDYAGAVLAARGVVEPVERSRLLNALGERQQSLADAAELDLVLTESALRRHVGGREVLRRQQEHLLGLAEDSAVTLRVLPLVAGALPMTGPFALLSFEANRPAQLVHRPGPAAPELVQATAEVRTYRDALQKLADSALGPDESIRWLREEVACSTAS